MRYGGHAKSKCLILFSSTFLSLLNCYDEIPPHRSHWVGIMAQRRSVKIPRRAVRYFSILRHFSLSLYVPAQFLNRIVSARVLHTQRCKHTYFTVADGRSCGHHGRSLDCTCGLSTCYPTVDSTAEISSERGIKTIMRHEYAARLATATLECTTQSSSELIKLNPCCSHY